MSQKTLYPLLLSDNLHTKVWGGTRIKPMKGLAPDSERIGESWECSAVPGSESIVENGIFAGRTLNSLVEEYGEKLLGKKVYGPCLIQFVSKEGKFQYMRKKLCPTFYKYLQRRLGCYMTFFHKYIGL